MKYDKALMKTANIWAEESSCNRAKVGCVLAIDGRVITTGYNGTISGADNCCEDACEVCGGTGKVASYEEQECDRCGGKGLTSKKTVVHAEANAVLFASKNGIPTDGATAYVTLMPCVECSKMLMQSGIHRVVYEKDYRDKSGIEFLKKHGMKVEKIVL